MERQQDCEATVLSEKYIVLSGYQPGKQVSQPCKTKNAKNRCEWQRKEPIRGTKRIGTADGASAKCRGVMRHVIFIVFISLENN